MKGALMTPASLPHAAYSSRIPPFCACTQSLLHHRGALPDPPYNPEPRTLLPLLGVLSPVSWVRFLAGISRACPLQPHPKSAKANGISLLGRMEDAQPGVTNEKVKKESGRRG
uniref:Uncharacterized protein n=1 Tax=Eutreptiella gymnastica TaxID=73025 RepID=A0A7S4GHJ8_9EUGL|mmetsp:Transcript_83751/g.139802  ORF Transcript_83751/g.139802 Transcript_83751/m.139802 type:complete len:113 (+) Transcript_83751:349-687(+)|eukprot:CAMPEP_0174330588 /NCGR_PEP_ID=MMETSP0810-20121108/16806_1 /TAXON_ID=73025 ORGANISM="Eutreptiella gymnastica-like, Strain CCMP1594" /NCGR_SAMPLE_ID=MMETSP0810 /ASSEMBLY_ACC=CAM_ASM_000659 /LENGTH=112 /DNA_ID=CAMNT_0015445863 /DNA_START=338 /DNA_END=676 /DNA_ORIENTATION=+